MKYAIISDVHANEAALRSVLADARSEGAERVICLGDVVGYGPLPQEALRLVRANAAVTLAGNHDDAVSGRQGADDFIDLAGDAVQRHREALDADSLAWLRALPYTCELDGALAAHGDFVDPKKFYYVDDEEGAKANFNATAAQLMFVGHTHVPCLYLTGQSGAVYRLDAQDFSLEDGKRYIVNPGSVGYPREANGQCFSSYAIYDSTARAVFFRQLPFSVSSVMQRGKSPRRRFGIVLAASVLALAAVASALIFYHEKPAEVKTVTVEVKVDAKTDPALVIDEKSLTLPTSATDAFAHLKIKKGTGPVELRVEFKSASGNSLKPYTRPVSGSFQGKISIPEGATSARFIILRQTPDAQPKILSFAPSAK